jgi:ABC-type multidrug transport system ATPase subunit
MPEYCSHIGIMSKGKLVQFGTVGQLTHQTDDSRRQYMIQLARPIANVASYFQMLPGVSGVTIDSERIVCEYAADRESAAELLAHLVVNKLPVASFSPQTFDLEAAYMRAGVGQVD